MTISKLKKKVWTEFSKYVRRKNSKNGMCQCVTCGAWNTIGETDAGHYIHGNTKPTYFDERNVHPQCTRCNMHLNGNLVPYAIYLENKYGFGIIQELKIKSNGGVWKRQILEDLLKEYKRKNAELELN